MADSMSCPQTNHYMPTTQYYSSAHVPSHGHVHDVGPPSRPENTQRKRPKYTRSKTGCLTCRVKKIKCDETKPDCMRCTHGQRDCIWPEGVPARKKSSSRKDPVDRPSTAGSSGPSESSTPPTRDHTPPKRTPFELGLPPLASRRQSDSCLLQLHPVHDLDRRQHGSMGGERSSSGHAYPPMHHPASNAVLSMIPEISSYPRYDQGYTGRVGPRLSHHHQPMSQWNHQSVLSPVDHVEPFFHNVQERSLVGHSSHNDHQHARYQ